MEQQWQLACFAGGMQVPSSRSPPSLTAVDEQLCCLPNKLAIPQRLAWLLCLWKQQLLLLLLPLFLLRLLLPGLLLVGLLPRLLLLLAAACRQRLRPCPCMAG